MPFHLTQSKSHLTVAKGGWCLSFHISHLISVILCPFCSGHSDLKQGHTLQTQGLCCIAPAACNNPPSDIPIAYSFLQVSIQMSRYRRDHFWWPKPLTLFLYCTGLLALTPPQIPYLCCVSAPTSQNVNSVRARVGSLLSHAIASVFRIVPGT